MARLFLNLTLVSILYHFWTCGVIVQVLENGDNSNGIGVSAFSSTSSSVRLPLHSAPKATITDASDRTRVSGLEYLPFVFIIYAKNPVSNNQQESKSTIVTTSLPVRKGDTNIDIDIDVDVEEEPSIPPMSVTGPFALLLTSQFLLFIGVGAVIPSILLYGKEIGLLGAANGIVISAPAVALFLAANWSGRRADIARKPAMMIGMVVIAVSDIGTALAQGIFTETSGKV